VRIFREPAGQRYAGTSRAYDHVVEVQRIPIGVNSKPAELDSERAR
jgi:hypothetical protein